MIAERFLREIWKGGESFLQRPLLLSDGSEITVLECGIENEHRGGPDFLGARIVIDGVVVSGDVELHLTPNGWNAHNHEEDNRYSNVILHVVLESEENHAGPPVPELILRDNLLFDRQNLWTALFERVYEHPPELVCFPESIRLPMRFKRKLLEKFGNARLEELIDRYIITSEVQSEQTLLERVFQQTMDALGYSQNRIPFRELSSLLPLSRLRFVRSAFPGNTSLAFEALFFGVAGLLVHPNSEFDTETNEHLIELQACWNLLQLSIRFPEVLAENDWAFFRLRPANSPHRRLAVAAKLAEKYFGREDWNFRHEFFSEGPTVTIGENSYWESHTSFGTRLQSPQSLLGKERESAIWLNVILPARIARVRMESESPARREKEKCLSNEWGNAHTESSAKFLMVVEQELLEGENVSSVRSEQGALLLKRNFCEKHRCSQCPIGTHLLETGWKPSRFVN